MALVPLLAELGEALAMGDIATEIAATDFVGAAVENRGGLAAMAGGVALPQQVAGMLLSPGKTRAGTPYQPDPHSTTSSALRTAYMHRRINTGEDKNKMGPKSYRSGKPTLAGRTATDGEEVTVVPPPAKIAKLTPDYFTNICPLYTSFIYNTTGALTNRINSHAVLLRLNSIWDPVVGSHSNSQPHGRDQWAGVFNYYRVLESHWKIRWHNNNPSIATPQLRSAAVTANFGDPLLGNFICGYELVEDDTTSLMSDNIFSFMATKHAKRVELPSGVSSPTSTVDQVYIVKPGQTSCEIHYTPETWDHHVQTNTSAERWTPINASPTVDHYAALRCFHKGANSDATNKDNGIYIEVYVEFTVQWREHVSTLTKLVDSSAASGNDTAPNT